MRVHKSVVRDGGIRQTSVRVSARGSLPSEHKGSPDIREIAEDYERKLVAILRRKGVELQPFLNREGRQIGLVAWTLDALPWSPKKAAKTAQAREPITQDASAALTQLKFLMMSLEEGDIMEAAMDAYELGRLVERISLRQGEPRAARSRKTSVRSGGRSSK